MRPSLPSRRLMIIQRTAIAMVVVAGIVNFGDRMALSLANPLIRHDLGLSITDMGWLLSAFLWAYAFAQLPAGVMVDRIGPRWLLGCGLIAWSVAQAIAGFVTNLTQFILLRVILGIGEAPQFPVGARVVRDWFGLAARGLPTGIVNSVSTLGPALTPPILTMIMLSCGWRWMFLLLGLLGIAVGIAWILLYRDRKSYDLRSDEWSYLTEGDASVDRGPVTLAEWGSLFRYRTTWGMIAGTFGQGYVYWFYAAWLPGYLEMQRHISIPHAGWLAAIPYLFGVVGSLTGGWTSDALVRRGFRPVTSRKLLIVVGMLGASALTTATAVIDSNAAALCCIAVALFFTNLAGSCIWGLAVVAAPAKAVASLGSLQNFGGYLGGALAPVVTGFSVQASGSFTSALLVTAGIGVSSAVIYFIVVRHPIVFQGEQL
ncbi:MFS transporter [Acidisoma silvae]|uniref:MFS transporter n=1 Tax=Acidisoma silvae TaxID=2802396 RepID=A0A963YVT9_9PROT|nr:MFS transporter [Acidisoma silvae]MCB8878038.1 MFS transporter [Acidisoma silvae]